MPWLHLIFEAWDDYKQIKKKERKAKKQAGPENESEDHVEMWGEGKKEKKKKRKKK